MTRGRPGLECEEWKGAAVAGRLGGKEKACVEGKAGPALFRGEGGVCMWSPSRHFKLGSDMG